MREPAPKAGIWANLGFTSWLAYGFLSKANHWLEAALAGLLISLIIIAFEHRDSAVKLMDVTAFGYFAFAGLAVSLGARELLVHYNVPMAWGLFAIVAWLTSFLNHPFTEQYAREKTPPELWGDPLFHRMNHEITAVWAVVFTFGATLGALSLYVGHGFELGVVLPMIAMGTGFIFNRLYPRRYRARLTAGRTGGYRESVASGS